MEGATDGCKSSDMEDPITPGGAYDLKIRNVSACRTQDKMSPTGARKKEQVLEGELGQKIEENQCLETSLKC